MGDTLVFNEGTAHSAEFFTIPGLDGKQGWRAVCACNEWRWAGVELERGKAFWQSHVTQVTMTELNDGVPPAGPCQGCDDPKCPGAQDALDLLLNSARVVNLVPGLNVMLASRTAIREDENAPAKEPPPTMDYLAYSNLSGVPVGPWSPGQRFVVLTKNSNKGLMWLREYSPAPPLHSTAITSLEGLRGLTEGTLFVVASDCPPNLPIVAVLERKMTYWNGEIA
jgi:hypothetical protein